MRILAVLVTLLWSLQAGAKICGGENSDDCSCTGDFVNYNFCWCCPGQDGSCGNCVWHAWHMACCSWGRALEWCSTAYDWVNQAQKRAYPMGKTPHNRSIFVCGPNADDCSKGEGHVGWVVKAYADGSFDSTEQDCYSECGKTVSHHREKGFGGNLIDFIYNVNDPTIDDDEDGYSPPQDCNDYKPEVHPDAPEICANIVDDDCDGVTDTDCPGAEPGTNPDGGIDGYDGSGSDPGTKEQELQEPAREESTADHRSETPLGEEELVVGSCSCQSSSEIFFESLLVFSCSLFLRRWLKKYEDFPG